MPQQLPPARSPHPWCNFPSVGRKSGGAHTQQQDSWLFLCHLFWWLPIACPGPGCVLHMARWFQDREVPVLGQSESGCLTSTGSRGTWSMLCDASSLGGPCISPLGMPTRKFSASHTGPAGSECAVRCRSLGEDSGVCEGSQGSQPWAEAASTAPATPPLFSLASAQAQHRSAGPPQGAPGSPHAPRQPRTSRPQLADVAVWGGAQVCVALAGRSKPYTVLGRGWVRLPGQPVLAALQAEG